MVDFSSQRLCLGPNARSKAESSSRAISSTDESAADGFARTTSRLPAGSRCKRSRTICRSRRRTLLRCTARPTPRPTMNPARGGSSSSRANTYTTSRRRPTRRPLRSAMVKSSRRRILDPAGSTSAPIRKLSVLLGRQTRRARHAGGVPQPDSAGQAGTTPAPARCHDRPTGPGTHAEPEAVGPRPAAIVRLECALAHEWLRLKMGSGAWRPTLLRQRPRTRRTIVGMSTVVRYGPRAGPVKR